jgi:chromatin remodeling complex protein RSC6
MNSDGEPMSEENDSDADQGTSKKRKRASGSSGGFNALNNLSAELQDLVQERQVRTFPPSSLLRIRIDPTIRTTSLLEPTLSPTSTEPARDSVTCFSRSVSADVEAESVLAHPQLSRPQTVKRIWEYVKERDLQDSNDRRYIICDEKLKAVFKTSKVSIFLRFSHPLPLS